MRVRVCVCGCVGDARNEQRLNKVPGLKSERSLTARSVIPQLQPI